MTARSNGYKAGQLARQRELERDARATANPVNFLASSNRMALPEADRVELVRRLLESLSPEPEDVSEDDWVAELERRRAEAASDPSAVVPWSELKRQT